ncbi:MAG: hypothetical protein RLZZ612_2061 [Pseudomonadota bacterium]
METDTKVKVNQMKMPPLQNPAAKAGDYVTRVLPQGQALDERNWQTLIVAEAAQGRDLAPFISAAYLNALQDSGSAVADTGWRLHWVTLWRDEALQAACPLYLKDHSYGEYVFDWAWADAHHRHGLPYYPKGLIALPFTPVPGPRLLACDAQARVALLAAVLQHSQTLQLSSLHLLFTDPLDRVACEALGLLTRQTVQFHWHNRHSAGFPAPASPMPFESFEDFLSVLQRDKRKKIRQERRKVADAGVVFRTLHGKAITDEAWDFFYACYERTYLEHRNAPYLTRDFFRRLAQHQPEHWLLFVAERGEQAIASSLIALNASPESAIPPSGYKVAYGRYWGALERVDCLHFEACYYQPIEWCIQHGYHRFEGGAQGEHKMARALLPTPAYSAHWLAHPAFADAIDRYLQREALGIADYMTDLEARQPLRQNRASPPYPS